MSTRNVKSKDSDEYIVYDSENMRVMEDSGGEYIQCREDAERLAEELLNENSIERSSLRIYKLIRVDIDIESSEYQVTIMR